MGEHDEQTAKVCKNIIQVGLRQYRYRLKAHYWPKIEKLSLEQAFLMKPPKVEDKFWKSLVATWFDEHYRVQHSYSFIYILFIRMFVIYGILKV